MEQIKRAFIDVETTGLRPYSAGIHQLALIIDINEEIKEEKVWNIRPFPTDDITDKALEISGVSRDKLMSYPEPFIIYDEISALLGKYVDKFNPKDKYKFLAYNSPFDSDFVRSFLSKNGDKYFGSWFYYPDICVMRKMSDRFYGKNRPYNSRLGSVAEHLGIIEDKNKVNLHDALTDIRLTRDIYYKLRKEYEITNV